MRKRKYVKLLVHLLWISLPSILKIPSWDKFFKLHFSCHASKHLSWQYAHPVSITYRLGNGSTSASTYDIRGQYNAVLAIGNCPHWLCERKYDAYC